MNIRDAAEHEAGLLSDLALRSKAHWGYSRDFLDACRAELTYSDEDLCDLTCVVAEVEGEIVGFYALERLSPTMVELEALFVEPACIGRGYGRALIEHAKSTARRMEATAISIQSDPYAEAFYRAAGAERVGTRESDSISGRMLPLLDIPLLNEPRSPLPAAGRRPGR
jgi:N-acetylglutamate synthase-like GNAT family acetyltransferase